MKRTCQICNNEFNAWPSYVKRGGGVYCSRECKNKAQSIRLLNNPPEKSPRWKGGLLKKLCLNCSKEIIVKRCFLNKPSFCSLSCASSYHAKRRNQKLGKILKCKICGKDFYRSPSHITEKPQFCSIKCKSINNIKNQKKKDTDIEQIIEDWLKESKIEHVKQKNIGGIALVDFFVPPNKCLFCDGDYWHSSYKRITIDDRQRSELKAKGYEVYSLLGSKIMEGERFSEISQDYSLGERDNGL